MISPGRRLFTRTEQEALLGIARTVAREKLLTLQWWFTGHEVGPQMGWALPNSRQVEYHSYEVRVDITDAKTNEQVADEFQAGLQRIEDEVLSAKKALEAAGGQDVRLVWRYEDRARLALEPRLSEPDNAWVLKLRARIALTTAQERDAEKRAPKPDEDGFSQDVAVVRAPRATLYTDEQILDIRRREMRATEIATHAQYTRIPWTGLYALTNCRMLRFFRRMWAKRWLRAVRRNSY